MLIRLSSHLLLSQSFQNLTDLAIQEKRSTDNVSVVIVEFGTIPALVIADSSDAPVVAENSVAVSEQAMPATDSVAVVATQSTEPLRVPAEVEPMQENRSEASVSAVADKSDGQDADGGDDGDDGEGDDDAPMPDSMTEEERKAEKKRRENRKKKQKYKMKRTNSITPAVTAAVADVSSAVAVPAAASQAPVVRATSVVVYLYIRG
jgi:hypothetical protein